MIGLPYGEKNCNDMLSRFHLIPERYGRTDRRTDRRTDLLYQYRASVCWCAIKTIPQHEIYACSSRGKLPCKKLSHPETTASNLVQVANPLCSGQLTVDRCSTRHTLKGRCKCLVLVKNYLRIKNYPTTWIYACGSRHHHLFPMWFLPVETIPPWNLCFR